MADVLQKSKKHLIINLAGLAAFILFMLMLFWILFLNHVDVNEIGVAYDSWDGTVTLQDKPGWYFTPLTVKVVTISTLPMAVQIPSVAKVINVKIVKFRPEGVKEYIALQGFDYSLGQNTPNALMGYAFSGKKYPFLEVLQESGNEETIPTGIKFTNPTTRP